MVITRSSDKTIAQVNILDPLISDHSAVLLDLRTKKTPLPKRVVSFRKYKNLCLDTFKADIQNSSLTSFETSNADDMFNLYDKVLTELLDKHVPLKQHTLTIRSLAPWQLKCDTFLLCPSFNVSAISGIFD